MADDRLVQADPALLAQGVDELERQGYARPSVDDLVAAGKVADVALDFEGLARDAGRDMGSIARRSSPARSVSVTTR